MTTPKARNLYSVTLVILDSLMVASAFIFAYYLRATIPWPAPLANTISLPRYVGLLLVQVAAVIIALFFYRQYYIPRAVSRVDQFYAVFAAVSIGTMMAIAISAFAFKNNVFEVDYPRAMIVYAWVLTIILLMLGRVVHQIVRGWLQDRGVGKDRVLIVGTDETARIILQRIQWSPRLGYEVVGLVDNNPDGVTDVLGVPVLGTPEELPTLIPQYGINEVIIATPERGHRETVRIISQCERGRVTIKVFPDIFQIIASQATIDDLGGLPLLTIRDYAMHGYMLVFKRLMDVLGSVVGLVFFSPLMLLVAVAIKLESPGSVFFIQERMGLDGKPFPMIKFRSMRSDAERSGPGWTVQNDPRQTKLGRLLRKIEIDELPNFINVLLGEMSLVGPRPEQPHYVNLFHQSIPRYMDRHREKAGMTGWAQVNGLRGDTSVLERTKYDLWYVENWSILLDIKIVARTIWQTLFVRKRPA
ncbi:MAG: undecaprenyl-phosphate glucose phosphotransferase [Chloroflexota bacterium]